MKEEKEQLKERLTMVFTIFLMESHSPMTKLFGFAQISLYHYHSLSTNELIELKTTVPKLREQYRSFREVICENMNNITNSSLLTTEVKQRISLLFTEFLYKSSLFINNLLAIIELGSSEYLDNENRIELRNYLPKAKEQYTEGRKIIHENLKVIESLINDVI